jgi:two-component system nitrogen regulation sensor histidine kinase GlnL
VARDLSGVLDAILAGIAVLDGAGKVQLVNTAACRILETSAEACAGLSVEQLLGTEHPVAKLTHTVLDSGRAAISSEYRIERRLAEDVVVEAAASPLSDDDGRANGAVLVLRDRTIQKGLEELVAERERLSAFGDIAAGIAHEVKNPLGGIRGAAEILASRAKDEKTRDTAELIVREVARIAALVDDLMVFTRGEEMQLAELNIHRVLDHVLDLLAMDPAAAGIRIVRAYDPSIPELLADGSRLTQVFLNLAHNALRAMERDGGTLTITTRMSVAKRVSAAGEDRAPTLLVTIADTGPGISPDVLARLATPFFTTREGGTGLGLAVSRHWVARHDGILHIDSKPGAGTAVQVAIPLRRPS